MIKQSISLLALCCTLHFTVEAQRKNVLLILADDFNHWAGAVGYYPLAKTPNVDRLASLGVLFLDAHSPSPVCNPSRNAIMSGYRPCTTGIMSNSDGYIREKPGFENVVTMNQYFKESGYYTYAGGKIYHPGKMGDLKTDPENWNGLYKGATGSPGGPFYKWGTDEAKHRWSAGEFDISKSNDTQLAHHMAAFLTHYSESDPFFLACGFFRPHLPWNVHKQFYDLFKVEDLVLPPGYKENDLDDIKSHANGMEIHKTIVKDGVWKEGIRAYLANLAYADYNIGILLDALENSKHKDNTIVVFAGDHGWHLGEKERWSKHAVYDQANRTTFIIYDPSAPGNGTSCRKVVSLQDIYPTLISLTGLPEKHDLEGNDLSTLLRDPKDKHWDLPVLMSYRGTHYIKTNRWRFVDTGETSQLYNIEEDPYEWDNLYGEEALESVVDGLRSQIDSIRNIGRNLTAH